MTYPARLASGLPLAALGTDNALFAAIREAFPTIRARLHNGEEYQITMAGKTYADDCAAYVSKPYGRGNTTELQDARQEVWNAAKIMADWQAPEAGPEEIAPVVALPTETEARAQVLAMTARVIDEAAPMQACHMIQSRELAPDHGPLFWVVTGTPAQHRRIARALALMAVDMDRRGVAFHIARKGTVALSAAILDHTETALYTVDPVAYGPVWKQPALVPLGEARK